MNANFTPADPDRHIERMFRPFILTSQSYLIGCSDANNGNGYSMDVLAFFACIAFISMISATFVGLTIFYNPKLSIHPSKLIGYMCFCEALASYNSLIWAA